MGAQIDDLEARHPGSTPKDRRDLVVFFGLAYAITWAGQLPVAAARHGLIHAPIPPMVGILAAFGPALAAVLLSGVRSGPPALRALLARLLRWRAGPTDYLIAIGAPVLISAMAIGLTVVCGGQGPDYGHAMIAQLPLSGATRWLMIPLLFVAMALGPDGVGEELGWRGYALPRMVERLGALRASLVLGVLWAAWHLPTLWGKGDLTDPAYVSFFMIEVMADSLIATCLFLRSRGGVLLPILFHAAGNTTWAVAPIDYHADHNLYVTSLAVRWVLAVLIFIWRHPVRPAKPDHLLPGYDPPGQGEGIKGRSVRR